jgi:hypothetical protein
MSSSPGSPAFIGDNELDNLVYLGFSLIGFGVVFFLYLILTEKSKPDDEGELD